MDACNWRDALHPDSRERIISKIMDTLKRHLPFSGEEGLLELKKIAVRFEERIYEAAVSQGEYLRKISMKMLTMETKNMHPIPHPFTFVSTSNYTEPSNSSEPPAAPGAVRTLSTTCKRRTPDDVQLHTDSEIGIKKARHIPEAGETAVPVSPSEEPIFSCPVCMGNLIEPTTTKCGHIFCKECLKKSLKAMQNKCPTCREKVGKRGTFRVYLPTTK